MTNNAYPQAAERERDALRAAITQFLRDNDPEGFGCACEPNRTCGPCAWAARVKPLNDALRAAGRPREAPSQQENPGLKP